jgi:DNA-binding transcriptional MerR regulator
MSASAQARYHLDDLVAKTGWARRRSSCGTRPRYHLDDLVAKTGVPSRTLRYWQTVGALAPPRREGRVGLYGDGHLERIRLLGELQERGLRLTAAAELAQRLEEGSDSVREWLGLQSPATRHLDHSSAGTGAWLSEQDLLKRAGGDASLVPAFERMGLISRDRPTPKGPRTPEDGWWAPNAGLLDLAFRLAATGADAETTIGAEAILRHRMRQAAEELVAWFSERLARVDNPRSARARFETLRSIGIDGARLVLRDELDRSFQRTSRRAQLEARTEREWPAWLRWVVRRRERPPA